MTIFDGLPPVTAAPLAVEDVAAGKGPFKRLVLQNATVIDGTGAPPYGPADLIVEGDRITAILTRNNATNLVQPGELRDRRPGDEVIDLRGAYVLPGFIDSHAHIGSSAQIRDAEYAYKLWLGHGVTTVRELGSMTNGFPFTSSESRRSREGEIVAPHIEAYLLFGAGGPGPIVREDEARSWIRRAWERGAQGVKFFGAPPNVMRAALEEAASIGLPTACHHAQSEVARVNALTSARWGLGSVEHWYGLPESLFTDRTVQAFPSAYNYLDERARFAAAGELWQQAAPVGSARWSEVIEELVGLGTVLVPTLNIYIATRDVARVRGTEWFADYLSPTLERFFTPSEQAHGSFFSDWGTEQEVSWRHAYALWMAFIKDFHDRGGVVAAGSDSGFIYKLYGFGLAEELELLREAGLAPLEVIRAVTLHGARLLGMEEETGSIEPGKRADLLVVRENPLANLKVLYGHGHLRYDSAGVAFRTGGVETTIKGGVVYDAARLRQRVRELVGDERASTPRSVMRPEAEAVR